MRPKTQIKLIKVLALYDLLPYLLSKPWQCKSPKNLSLTISPTLLEIVAKDP